VVACDLLISHVCGLTDTLNLLLEEFYTVPM